jgi:nitroimidazol reductase NimA-like FMN-containing flavoprotein (pyridoxamine 5'-phosphate oxidase superfamily)
MQDFFLVMSGENNQPYVVPMNFGYSDVFILSRTQPKKAEIAIQEFKP